MNPIHISGLGESRFTEGSLCWWISTWRHDDARGGAVPYTSVEWFDSHAAFLARLNQFTAEAPTS